MVNSKHCKKIKMVQRRKQLVVWIEDFKENNQEKSERFDMVLFLYKNTEQKWL